MEQQHSRITSLATIAEILQRYPQIHRIIFKKINDETWEIVKYDDERPTDMSYIAKVTNGYFGYERNVKRGFESLTGYDINVDAIFKVVYRLSDNPSG
jgi:hypothetical protein